MCYYNLKEGTLFDNLKEGTLKMTPDTLKCMLLKIVKLLLFTRSFLKVYQIEFILTLVATLNGQLDHEVLSTLSPLLFSTKLRH
jgi:hypothetical protein